MGGPYRRKKTHKCDKETSKKFRLRRRTKDLDQIENDIKPENRDRVMVEALDEDLPGGGSFLCLECSRHFIDQNTLDAHKSTKDHKRRLRQLAVPAYTLEEANAAGGSSSNAFYSKKLEKIQGESHKGKSNFKKIDVASEAAGESLMTYE